MVQEVRKRTVRSVKTRIVPELVDGCNLRCALCWNKDRTGSGKQMSLETIDKILKKYNDFSYEISWFNWGDPLLHNEFETAAQMIGKISSQNIVSSSMSLPISDDRLESLRNFDLVHLTMSGLTPDAYRVYHTNGNLDLVMKNIKRLSKLKLKNVRVGWLRHKYNEFQLKDAREFAREMGFDFNSTQLSCQVENLIDGFEHELLKVPKFPRKRHWCGIRYWTPIDVDGNYLLCCASHNVKIGYSIDDEISPKELRNVKSKTELCTTCREHEFWRMF
jgi:MoaA/NifB/PqqE/SkfB family radical SAM enzyme